MTFTKRSILFGLAVTLLTAATPVAVRACNLPTFRYALERWQPYAYETLVYYDRSLPASLHTALEGLEQHPLNLAVWLVDVSREDMHEELKKVWDREKGNASLPWAVVRYPHPAWEKLKRDTVWSGNFDADTLSRIVDSPVRRTIAEHILNGVSIVWLFVDGADPAVNEAKLKLLNDRLAWIDSVAELPEVAVEEANRGELGERAPGFVPLKIAFEIIRIQRDDPEEKFLLDMLLKTDPDYGSHAGQPHLFAVYGQGRALPGLKGAGIGERAIDDTCFMLLGTPNDYVHEGTQGPGTDLLVRADWFGGVSNLLSVASEAPTLVGMTLPEAPRTAGPEAEKPAAAHDRLALGRIAAATLGILLVAVALISVKALKRNNS